MYLILHNVKRVEIEGELIASFIEGSLNICVEELTPKHYEELLKQTIIVIDLDKKVYSDIAVDMNDGEGTKPCWYSIRSDEDDEDEENEWEDATNESELCPKCGGFTLKTQLRSVSSIRRCVNVSKCDYTNVTSG